MRTGPWPLGLKKPREISDEIEDDDSVNKHDRYNRSEKGRERHRRYNRTEKGRARWRRWKQARDIRARYRAVRDIVKEVLR